MMSTSHYLKAPIAEAIIDMQLQPHSGFRVEELEKVRHGEQNRYPKKERLFEAHGMMQVQPGGATSAAAQQQHIGFKFTSQDGKYIWQTRINGFTFSRLAPYESWEPFRDEARRLWEICRKNAAPEKVTRLALRYINPIDLPAERVDLKDYFRTSPEVSPELPQQLAGFFMQLRIPQADLNSEVLINQTIISTDREDTIRVILDIDLFRRTEIPCPEEAMWSFIEKMRLRKNEIFEACITEKTRELFK